LRFSKKSLKKLFTIEEIYGIMIIGGERKILAKKRINFPKPLKLIEEKK